jgi:hypothetical protein
MRHYKHPRLYDISFGLGMSAVAIGLAIAAAAVYFGPNICWIVTGLLLAVTGFAWAVGVAFAETTIA